MTDEELFKRLRSDVQLNEVAEIAADRIEELVKELDDIHNEAMEWIAKWGAALVAQREAEAKLAKAVAALEYYAFEDVYGIGPARAILAELEKTE